MRWEKNSCGQPWFWSLVLVLVFCLVVTQRPGEAQDQQAQPSASSSAEALLTPSQELLIVREQVSRLTEELSAILLHSKSLTESEKEILLVYQAKIANLEKTISDLRTSSEEDKKLIADLRKQLDMLNRLLTESMSTAQKAEQSATNLYWAVGSLGVVATLETIYIIIHILVGR
jgi:hypothetical protein